MPTSLDFLSDPYAVEAEAVVLERWDDRIILDRTIFYPGTGISPGDRGAILLGDRRNVPVDLSSWLPTAPDVLEHRCRGLPDDLQPGQKVIVRIDWPSRYAAMRIHTALHLISVALPYPMVDGTIHAGRGSATFEVEAVGVQADDLEHLVHELVDRKLPVEAVWILPPLHDRRIRIRSFAWPGSGDRVRAMKIDAIDVQPCDGLHVRNTSEVGPVRITDVVQLPGNQYRCDVVLADYDSSGS